MKQVDVLIVGAGPAGMAAAVAARRFGLDVLVVDDQPAPGGQIWRSVETVAPTARGTILGESYRSGLSVAEAFRASGAGYEPGTLASGFGIEPRVEQAGVRLAGARPDVGAGLQEGDAKPEPGEFARDRGADDPSTDDHHVTFGTLPYPFLPEIDPERGLEIGKHGRGPAPTFESRVGLIGRHARLEHRGRGPRADGLRGRGGRPRPDVRTPPPRGRWHPATDSTRPAPAGGRPAPA